MAEIKAIGAVSKAAIDKVLKQQGEQKFWNGKAHAAALGYLAENYLISEVKHELSGVTSRKGFVQELNGEPWLYASNMKKRLEELKLIPANSVETSEYE